MNIQHIYLYLYETIAPRTHQKIIRRNTKKNIYQRLPTTGPFQALEPFLCLTRPGPRAERNDFSVHKHLGRSAVTDGEVENGEVVKRNRGCLLMRNYMQIEKANDTTWKLR